MSYLISVKESIKDILSTPLGARVMLPDYGSRLYELIDRKVDDEFRALLSWYVIEAVQKWEKRVSIEEVKLINFDGHSFAISIILDDGQELNIKV